jgi:hypothetical protein
MKETESKYQGPVVDFIKARRELDEEQPESKAE